MDKNVQLVQVPAKHIPPLRYKIGYDAGIKKIMMTTWGGLGDQVCAEPTLRYAFDLFKDKGYEICLLTSFPDFFTHLPFAKIYDNKSSEASLLNDEEWIVIHTYHPNHNMTQDFLSHGFMHCVDFSSICAFQRQLPIKSRHIQLPMDQDTGIDPKSARIIVHPGKTWDSRTLPAWWWNEVVGRLCNVFSGVAVIGHDVSETVGTVDIDIPANCTDLRNKLSLLQMSAILQNAKIVITNDSSPIHIASAGDAHILFLSTCKEPDHLKHWRYGEFGWRMRNLSLGGLWMIQDSCPIREEALELSQINPATMDKFLPNPRVIVEEARKAIFS